MRPLFGGSTIHGMQYCVHRSFCMTWLHMWSKNVSYDLNVAIVLLAKNVRK